MQQHLLAVTMCDRCNVSLKNQYVMSASTFFLHVLYTIYICTYDDVLISIFHIAIQGFRFKSHYKTLGKDD